MSTERLNPSMELIEKSRKTAGGMKLRALQNQGRQATRDAIAAAAKLLRAGAEPWREVVARWLACAESDAARIVEYLSRNGGSILVYPNPHGGPLVALRQSKSYAPDAIFDAAFYAETEAYRCLRDAFANISGGHIEEDEFQNLAVRIVAALKGAWEQKAMGIVDVYHRVYWQGGQDNYSLDTCYNVKLGEVLDTGLPGIDNKRSTKLAVLDSGVVLVPVSWAKTICRPCSRCNWDGFKEEEKDPDDEFYYLGSPTWGFTQESDHKHSRQVLAALEEDQ